jgi:hypothetical protein
MKKIIKHKNLTDKEIISALSLLLIAVGFFYSFTGISEYYIISIKKDIDAYPWGDINENPWYYKSPEVYGIYNLINGVAFLIASIGTLIFVIKQRRALILIGTAIIVFLLLFNGISG